ncbi:MAG: AAC(3) family N-acetyltransferase [Erysipelotrichaceae bacterium]
MLGKQEIVEQLKKLGVYQGMILEVHASLHSFGHVVGGAQSVVDALIEAVGYNGTLLMPLQSYENTEPSTWKSFKGDLRDICKIRAQIPPYNKKDFEAREMGAICDNLRRRDGVVISEHPNMGYLAWGKYAKLLCNHQSLHFALSQESPAARLNELKGSILMMGVGFEQATSMHLAEYYSDVRPVCLNGAMREVSGEKQFESYLELDLDAKDFISVAEVLKAKGYVQSIMIGTCLCQMVMSHKAIEYTSKYLKENSILQYYQ